MPYESRLKTVAAELFPTPENASRASLKRRKNGSFQRFDGAAQAAYF